jgi:hypothetical protein
MKNPLTPPCHYYISYLIKQLALSPLIKVENQSSMIKDADSERPDSRLICSWCGKSFSPESNNQARGFVCPKCVRILEGAGVSHEEIFGLERKIARLSLPTGSPV